MTKPSLLAPIFSQVKMLSEYHHVRWTVESVMSFGGDGGE